AERHLNFAAVVLVAEQLERLAEAGGSGAGDEAAGGTLAGGASVAATCGRRDRVAVDRAGSDPAARDSDRVSRLRVGESLRGSADVSGVGSAFAGGTRDRRVEAVLDGALREGSG